MTETEKKALLDAHFEEYRRGCGHQFRNVQEVLRFWVEWQEATAQILGASSVFRKEAEQKLADAKQRRSEAVYIAEKAKERRGRRK